MNRVKSLAEGGRREREGGCRGRMWGRGWGGAAMAQEP